MAREKRSRRDEVADEAAAEPAVANHETEGGEVVTTATTRTKTAKAPRPDRAAAKAPPPASPPPESIAESNASFAAGATKIEGRPFSDFNLAPETCAALKKSGIANLFPVQAQTYDAIMKGKDILVQARTGSGKTLAFAIPIIEKLAAAGPGARQQRGRGPAAVVFCPTRELAIQVKDVIAGISRGYIVTALYGGVAYAAQESVLRSGVDVVVATPGRAKDLLEKRTLRFDRVAIAVLDEADHMLDIGFKDDIELLLRKVAEQNGSTAAAKPNGEINGESGDGASAKKATAGARQHQTLLFSATIPEWVHKTPLLGKDKVVVDLVGQGAVKTAATIRFFRRKCQFSEVSSMLADLIRVYSGKHGRTLVFTNTKKDCHDLSINNSKLDSQCLHGDMQQEQRESTMKSFRDNKFGVLIATDVAARGLDLPLVDLVIQCAPPADIDSFIHRAGRTGRAGRKGVCVLLHTLRDEYVVEKIERHAKIRFDVLPAPTREDILRAVARDVTEDLSRVERRATELFREQAELLLKEADPIEILASALAVMSGYTTNISKRGLLTGADNCATIRLVTERPLPVPVYCSILRGQLGDDVFMRCREITLLLDAPGCVFDVPENMVDHVLAMPLRDGMEIGVVESLPPIIARELSGGRGGRGGFGGGRGGFGRGGGFGGGRGGGGFGGFGGRGGGGFGGGRGGGGFGGRGGHGARRY